MPARSSWGSPPHSRGMRQGGGRVDRILGITPAFAGKASMPTSRTSASRDHPRIRGEGTLLMFLLAVGLGSPPHSRGRRRLVDAVRKEAGITPAFAGKAATRSSSRCRGRDHPRIRGEGAPVRASLGGGEGSPPHSRGRPLAEIHVAIEPGITPAFAGKAPEQAVIPFRFWDHPRIRGEGSVLAADPESYIGSPPHSRGRPRPI